MRFELHLFLLANRSVRKHGIHQGKVALDNVAQKRSHMPINKTMLFYEGFTKEHIRARKGVHKPIRKAIVFHMEE